MTALEGAWWQRETARADRPPLRPRRALRLEGIAAPVGSVEAVLADRLRGAGLPLRRRDDGEVLCGPPDAALADVAVWLRDHALAGKWRDELLPVTDVDGHRHAAVERAAVRPLGIATFAVHLIGHAPGRGTWVQQRALDKATDPGLWDTLVGGLVADGETSATALERETWEEAGLSSADLRALRAVDRLVIRRPVGEGYMVEHIEVFEAALAPGAVPVNRDGEVARFDCLAPSALAERLAQGRFTLEAGLMLAAGLRRPAQHPLRG